MSDALRDFTRGTDPLKRFVVPRIFVFLYIVWPLKCLWWGIQANPVTAAFTLFCLALGFLLGRWL